MTSSATKNLTHKELKLNQIDKWNTEFPAAQAHRAQESMQQSGM